MEATPPPASWTTTLPPIIVPPRAPLKPIPEDIIPVSTNERTMSSTKEETNKTMPRRNLLGEFDACA